MYQLAELGDAEFVDEMIDLFVELSERQTTEMRCAVDERAAEALARAAHKLKGACLGMFAQDAAMLADKLEQAGRGADLSGARELLLELTVVLAETISQMRGLRLGPPPRAEEPRLALLQATMKATLPPG
jgi:HPt (histidine-containing phosphotransfer) domain-containing protein